MLTLIECEAVFKLLNTVSFVDLPVTFHFMDHIKGQLVVFVPLQSYALCDRAVLME